MKYLITIEVEALNERDAKKALSSLGFEVMEVQKKKLLRTLTQNRALHKWCTQIAEELNNAGITVQDIIIVERSWTMESFKELVYKHILKKKYGKDSTTKMTQAEMDAIFDDINLWLGNMGIHVPFPSVETLMEKYGQE